MSKAINYVANRAYQGHIVVDTDCGRKLFFVDFLSPSHIVKYGRLKNAPRIATGMICTAAVWSYKDSTAIKITVGTVKSFRINSQLAFEVINVLHVENSRPVK